MSRAYPYLRGLHPIPVFDDHVVFFDYVVVDSISQRALTIGIDWETGRLLPDTPPLTSQQVVANHRYFYNSIPVRGSVTALQYFDKFDAVGNARRIATGSRIMEDREYKYYHFARGELCQQWPTLRLLEQRHRHLLYMHADEHYVDAELNNEEHVKRGNAFRAVADPFVEKAILASWEKNRDETAELGTAMHKSIQLYYENQAGDMRNPRFELPEFKQFLAYHRRRVEKRGLRILRTELSMFDPYSLLNGTIDAVYEVVKNGEGAPNEPIDVVLADWKRTKDVSATSFRQNEFGKPPFEDWPACKTSERWLQLLTYAKILEDNTNGRYRVVGALIVALHPDIEEILGEIFDQDPHEWAMERGRAYEAARQRLYTTYVDENNKPLASVQELIYLEDDNPDVVDEIDRLARHIFINTANVMEVPLDASRHRRMQTVFDEVRAAKLLELNAEKTTCQQNLAALNKESDAKRATEQRIADIDTLLGIMERAGKSEPASKRRKE